MGHQSMMDLCEATLKANAFSEWRGKYPEEFDWNKLSELHGKLQQGMKGGSLKPMVRDGFRADDKGEDYGFKMLSSIETVCEVMESIHKSMEPRERTPEIAHQVGEVTIRVSK